MTNSSAVTGALTMDLHDGGAFNTGGNVTVPNTASFTVTLKAGATGHTVGVTGAAETYSLDSGDIVSVMVFATDDVKLTKVLAANVVALPTGGHITPPPVLLDYTQRIDAVSPTRHWPMSEATAANGEQIIERIAADNGTYRGTVEVAPAGFTIARFDDAGRTKAFGGPVLGYATITNPAPMQVNSFWIHMLVQLDRDAAKHLLLTLKGVDTTIGTVSYEVTGGGVLRIWTHDGVTERVLESVAGIVPIGDAFALDIVQVSDAADGGRWAYINGAPVIADTTVKTFPALPVGTWHVGVWQDEVQAPMDGLMQHLMMRAGSAPSLAQVESLAMPQSLSYATSFAAGNVNESSRVVIDLAPHIHSKGSVTPLIGTPAPAFGTATANGDDIEFVAAAVAADQASSIIYRFSDDRGPAASFATISLTVLNQAAAVEEFTCLARPGAPTPSVPSATGLKPCVVTGTANARYDARGKTWQTKFHEGDQNAVPIQINGSPNGCWSGGLVFSNSTRSEYDPYPRSNPTAIMLGNSSVTHGFLIEGVRLHNCWDGIRDRPGVSGVGSAQGFRIKGCWWSYNRDDVIEMDNFSVGTVEDILVEDCMTFYSQFNLGTRDVRTQVAVTRDSIVRMGGVPNRNGGVGYYHVYKLSTRCPIQKLVNNKFHVPHGGNFGINSGIHRGDVIPDPFKELKAYGKMTTSGANASSGNIIYWSGKGDYPYSPPPGFSWTTDISGFNAAVAKWKAAHPKVMRMPGVD